MFLEIISSNSCVWSNHPHHESNLKFKKLGETINLSVARHILSFNTFWNKWSYWKAKKITIKYSRIVQNYKRKKTWLT